MQVCNENDIALIGNNCGFEKLLNEENCLSLKIFEKVAYFDIAFHNN